jgi:hypothetical protein
MWLYEELKKLYETSVSDGSLLKFDVV